MTCISAMGNVSYQQTFVFWEKCVNGCFVFRFLNEKYNAFQLPYFSFNNAVVTFAVFMSIYLQTLVWIVNVVRFLNEKYNAFQPPYFSFNKAIIIFAVFMSIYLHTLVWIVNVLLMLIMLMSGISKSLSMIWSTYSHIVNKKHWKQIITSCDIFICWIV